MTTQVLTKFSNDVTENRHEFIGASEIGIIMGVGLFKTPFQLWCEKTQKIEPEFTPEQQERMLMGQLLEDVIAQRYAAKHNVSVRRAPKVYVHPQYTFLRAHADRIVTGTEKGLECKNTSEYNSDKWNGEDIPEQYILQCQWLMGLSGRKEWDIAVLIGGNKYKDKTIKFDKDLFEHLVEVAVDFWNNNVLKDVPPALTEADNDTLKKLYPNNSDELLDLSNMNKELLDSFEEAIAQRQELKMHQQQINDEIAEIEAKIKDVIKENLGVKTHKYIVTWKAQTKTDIDKTLLKEEQPEIAEKYTKVSSFRVLRIKANKEMVVA